ncbi:potassium/sodium hyperpolarization-activated cyclic nucleotide-gated channel 2-like [Anoplophora glabripennis]|uniref:potassium/sodium hyperpolarization-activated cyclic nucleotide-gated channel 2-like n=1 Tax=Anoplophora glabripennis TaxID=217634 RepID=UPI000874435E|nr:potassium/sodium hyperpolarization-activated cyclic nucleotide-gated channel 2-like [Anoplophora glabripennis]
MTKFEDHECHLVHAEEEVLKHFIDTGFFISVRRNFRSWCIISKSHPETRRYFKSNASCREEEIRHLVSHYYMIHPFSKLSLYWEFYALLLFFTIYVVTAIDASVVFLKKENKLYLTKFTFDMLHIIDMIKIFFTGYYDEHRSKVILRSSTVAKGIRVVFIFFVVALWSFSINFFITNCIEVFVHGNVKNLWQTSIFDNFYEATSMFLWVSFGKYKVDGVFEYINTILFLCFGLMLQMFMYAQLLQVWIKYQSSENKQHSLYQQFEEYVRYQNLPVSLREKFFSYFNFKFHKDFFKESDINSMISPFMRQEILMHITRAHIERVDFFRYFPEKVLTKIVDQLKSEIFLPGDFIVSAGRTGTSMFFVYHGTVAVYTPTGKEICHLEDGAHFGEIALILSETRVASVIAVTPSELFVLKRPDFLAAIEYYPEIKDQLVSLATERLYNAVAQLKN